MTDIQTLECPNCGGHLEADLDGDNLITCDYCRSKIVTPEALRTTPRKKPAPQFTTLPVQSARLHHIATLAREGNIPEAIQRFEEIFGESAESEKQVIRLAEGRAIQMEGRSLRAPAVLSSQAQPFDADSSAKIAQGVTAATAAVSCGTLFFTLVIPLAILLFIGGILFFAIPNPLAQNVLSSWGSIAGAPVMEIGSEGIGPGQFTDARTVSVDGQGNIYVAEFGSSRVQVFSPEGNLLHLWNRIDDSHVEAISVSRDGLLYISQNSGLTVHNAMTGELIDTLTYDAEDDFFTGRFGPIALGADNGLVAVHDGDDVSLLWFSSDGNPTRFVEAVLSEHLDSASVEALAVDGLGNIYVLPTFENTILKFGPEGKLITRISSDGDAPGELSSPNGIAVDGNGRLYVTDTRAIQVFDRAGQYLNQIPLAGAGFGLAVDQEGFLYLAARTKIIKYQITIAED